jgi:hypothetical protein
MVMVVAVVWCLETMLAFSRWTFPTQTRELNYTNVQPPKVPKT